jgi:hypothetical protein
VRRSNGTPAALLAVLLLAGGCSRCGAPAAGPPVERWVPSSVAGVVLVPRLGEAARQAAALHGTLASLPGQYELQGARGALAAQLSFDPLDPASMSGAGLDPERGLAVAELARPGDDQAGQPLLVVAVGDAARFSTVVDRLARERLGAGERGLENANGKPVEVWRRAAGEPALLAATAVEGCALVSAGPDGPAAVKAALALDPSLSLAQSPAWQRARAALGDAAPVLVFVPPGAVAVPGSPAADGLAAGLSATARSVRLVAVALLGAGEPRFRPLAGPGPGRGGATSLEPATVLAARISASPAAALALLAPRPAAGQQPDALQRLAGALALPALAEALEPPIEVGLALAPDADVGAALAAPGELEPLRLFHAELAAGVKAGARLEPVLDELAKAAGGAGKGGRWRIPAGKAEVAVALAGQRLLVAAGPAGRIEPLVARGAGLGWKAPTPAAAEALAGGLGGLVLDGANLVKAVKALPPEAFGSGPDAVVARSLAEKLTAPGTGGTVSLRADLPAGALRLTVEVELAPPEPAR